MKMLWILATAIPFLGTVAFSQNVSTRSSAGQISATATNTKRGSPFACDRLALTPAERKRHFEELGPALRIMVKGVREVPNGYGYEFEFSAAPAAVQMVAEWAAGEHLCCPFFDIDMRLQRENGSLWLRLTGREGTKEFIKSDFAKWFKQ